MVGVERNEFGKMAEHCNGKFNIHSATRGFRAEEEKVRFCY